MGDSYGLPDEGYGSPLDMGIHRMIAVITVCLPFIVCHHYTPHAKLSTSTHLYPLHHDITHHFFHSPNFNTLPNPFIPSPLLYYRNLPNVSVALRSEFARGDGRVKKKEDERRKKITPNETLFVVNFHEETTKREDLQMLFEPYGELVRIDMKRNYAFVQFKTVEEAIRAKEATNGGKLDQSEITVEFVARRMGEGGRRDGGRTGGGGGGRRYDDDRKLFCCVFGISLFVDIIWI